MAELIILGSSAGIPTANRNNSSMVIKKDGRLYLFDCGGPASSSLKKMGEDPRDIQAVFLTHWHPDHAGGLPMLIQDQQLTQRKTKLAIYGPEGTHDKMKLLQTMFIIPSVIYPFELTTVEYDEDTVYEDETIKIGFFKTKHLSQEYWHKLDEQYNHEIKPVAYGLVVYCEGKKIVISGDMMSSNDLLPVLPDADLVVHEFGHIKPDALNRFVKEQEISQLLVTHIHHDWDDRDEELRSLIAAGHTGEICVARDLMRLKL